MKMNDQTQDIQTSAEMAVERCRARMALYTPEQRQELVDKAEELIHGKQETDQEGH